MILPPHSWPWKSCTPENQRPMHVVIVSKVYWFVGCRCQAIVMTATPVFTASEFELPVTAFLLYREGDSRETVIVRWRWQRYRSSWRQRSGVTPF